MKKKLFASAAFLAVLGSTASTASAQEVLTGDTTPLVVPALSGLRLGIPGAGYWDNLEPGVEQVIDVFEEPPSPSGFGGGTKIVVRKQTPRSS